MVKLYESGMVRQRGIKSMIDYMKFDVMWMDDVIATVDLRPANGGTPYVISSCVPKI